MAEIPFETIFNPELDSSKGRLDANEKANFGLNSDLLKRIRDLEASNKHLERRLIKVQDPLGFEERLAHLEQSGLLSRIASVEVAASESSVHSDTLPVEVKYLIQERESRFNFGQVWRLVRP